MKLERWNEWNQFSEYICVIMYFFNSLASLLCKAWVIMISLQMSKCCGTLRQRLTLDLLGRILY